MRVRRAVLSTVAMLVATVSLWGQSRDAISQLEAMSGQKLDHFSSGIPIPQARCDPNYSSCGTTADTRSQQPRQQQKKTVRTTVPATNQMAVGMVGGFLGEMLTPFIMPSFGSNSAQSDATVAEAARQQAAAREQQALLAWATAYSQRMNQVLSQQQQRRAGQNQESLESLSAALSEPWDRGVATGPAQGGGLAAALSDPGPAVVDLSNSKTLMPALLRDPNGAERRAKVTADEVLKRRQQAQARLRAMMEENRDLRRLGNRLYELENELSHLQAEATCITNAGSDFAADLDRWGWQVDRAVQDSLERGISLLTDTIIPAGTEAGFDRLRKNPKVWNQTLESFSQFNDFTDFVNEMGDRYDGVRQAVDWVQAKRNLFKDLDFIASNVGMVSKAWMPLSTQWEIGKDIVGSGIDVAQVLDAWSNIKKDEQDLQVLEQRRQVVQAHMKVLISQLQISRQVLAGKVGGQPEDLIPVSERPTVPPLVQCTPR